MGIDQDDVGVYNELYDNGEFTAISETQVEFNELNGGVGKVTADIEFGALTNFSISDPL